MLGALLHHALEPDAAARVAAHLDGCVACQQVALAAIQGSASLAATELDPVASGPDAAGRLVTLPGREPPGPARAPRGDDLVGTRFGRYELRARLGAGGMGAVFDAYDAELDRAVALKVLRPELSKVPGLSARLLHESRLTAKIAHPAVITVFDVGRERDAVFIAMELVRGSTLTAWLASHDLDWRAIVTLFERAGEGLDAAHGAGIVHRDFKPDNVLVAHDARKVVVTDFGIALGSGVDTTSAVSLAIPAGTETLRDAPETMDRAIIGTPAYMAPEQIARLAVDHRADVFAFCVALWEALCGERPFPGRNLQEIDAAMRLPVVRPASARGIPGRLVRALERGLAFEPRDRWPTMRALLDELAAIRGVRRRVGLALGAAALAGAVAAAFGLTRSEPPIDRCASALAALDEAYNPRLDAELRAALSLDPKLRDDVSAKLRAVADAWRATHVATCHADRGVAQEPATTACLASRRLELAAAVDNVISDGPSGAKYALRSAELPGAPARCAAPEPGLLFARVPAAREVRRKVTALRNRLSDANALLDRGELEAARAAVTEITAVAQAVWLPLQAEAQRTLGRVLYQIGDTKAATVTLLDSARTAERVHDDESAAWSWITVAQSVGFEQGDVNRGLEYLGYAELAAERLGHSPELALKLAYMKGLTLVKANRRREGELVLRGGLARAEAEARDADIARMTDGLAQLYQFDERYDEAAAMFRRAIEVSAKSPLTSPAVASVLEANLAMALAPGGKTQEAEALARHAAEVGDRSLAETRHQRPFMHLNLADILHEAGRSAEALIEATAAARAIARTQGERSQRYGVALLIHGHILLDLQRYAEAAPLLERACDIAAFTQSEASAEAVASCDATYAAALIGLGRTTEALAKLDRAIPLLVRADGQRGIPGAEALVTRGSAHAELGHVAAATADFEAAIAAIATKPIEPGLRATATWRLGKLLWRTQRVVARAKLAEALALFETANGRWALERDAATAWLARAEQR